LLPVCRVAAARKGFNRSSLHRGSRWRLRSRSSAPSLGFLANSLVWQLRPTSCSRLGAPGSLLLLSRSAIKVLLPGFLVPSQRVVPVRRFHLPLIPARDLSCPLLSQSGAVIRFQPPALCPATADVAVGSIVEFFSCCSHGFLTEPILHAGSLRALIACRAIRVSCLGSLRQSSRLAILDVVHV
jgi:hypothetical protein